MDELLTLGPCATCQGREQYFESDMPLGRTQELWRVVCKCGIASMRWSTTKVAAVRMWNRHMAEYEPKRKAPALGKNRTKGLS